MATEGVRGGFKLARPSDEITLLDIVNAIDSQKLIFDCREIRGRCALFGGQVDNWMNDRREKKGSTSEQASDAPLIQVTDISG